MFEHTRMARRALAVFGLAAATGLSGCSLLTPSLSSYVPDPVRTRVSQPEIATNGVLTVGIAVEDDVPQIMRDSDGQLTGYSVDVARALAKKLGLKVTFVPNSTAAKTGGDGEPDIFLGATADDASDELAVEGTYFEDAPALFAKGDASAPDVSALASATIAVQDGSSTQDALTSCGIKATVKGYSNVNECLEALDAGEVDYAACDASAGAYLARAYGDISLAGVFDTASSYGVAVRNMNVELHDAIVDALNELSTDGTLAAIHQAWYGSLPLALEEHMVGGISTSAEREQAEKEKEEAAKKAQEEAAADDGDAADSGEEGSDGDNTSSTSDNASDEGNNEVSMDSLF